MDEGYAVFLTNDQKYTVAETEKKCSYMDFWINNLDVKKNMWVGTVDGKNKRLDMGKNDCVVSLSCWTGIECSDDMVFKVATIKKN